LLEETPMRVACVVALAAFWGPGAVRAGSPCGPRNFEPSSGESTYILEFNGNEEARVKVWGYRTAFVLKVYDSENRLVAQGTAPDDEKDLTVSWTPSQGGKFRLVIEGTTMYRIKHN
jgi:hypothetical protein